MTKKPNPRLSQLKKIKKFRLKKLSQLRFQMQNSRPLSQTLPLLPRPSLPSLPKKRLCLMLFLQMKLKLEVQKENLNLFYSISTSTSPSQLNLSRVRKIQKKKQGKLRKAEKIKKRTRNEFSVYTSKCHLFKGLTFKLD